MANNPWEGKFSPNNFENKSLGIINRAKTAIDKTEVFERANELKKVIDAPTNFEGFRQWNSSENAQLDQARQDYEQIQKEKEGIYNNLDEMQSFFDIKSQEFQKLSQKTHEIQAKINEINRLLEEYAIKLQLLEDKDNKSEEELDWERHALIKKAQLEENKNYLTDSIVEIKVLQEELESTESYVTKQLENLLCSGCSKPLRDGVVQQSAAAICQEMQELKVKVLDISSSFKEVYNDACALFSGIFNKIKNLFSKTNNQLKSADFHIQESRDLLDKYPKSQLDHGL